jgi:murein L,D-transpeptidase YcbB/YkuD
MPFIRMLGLMMAMASALMASACTAKDEARSTADSSAPASAALRGSYAAMLAANGVGVAIPPRGKFILVNIPSFELIALQDGVPVLRSRVVVGRPATPTPELLSSMFAVKFNPSWTPTPSMVRYEGARYAPPGPHNPLGQILFELDNDELVFLHDTNDKTFFDLPQRALSHGCIRVQQARALAAWALGVSESEIDGMTSVGATRSVPLPEQIPVSLVYFTAFPDLSGQVVTYPDIYSRSRAVQQGRELAIAPSLPPCAAPLGGAAGSLG